MDRFKKILQKIFFLPPLSMVLVAVFGFGFAIAVSAFQIENSALEYLSYIFSTYAMIIAITGFPYLIAFVKRIKRRVMESTPKKSFVVPRSGNAISTMFGSARNCLFT